MKGKTKELWEHYCEQAAVEQDSETLMQLVQEIDRMLEEKEKGLRSGQDQESSENTQSRCVDEGTHY